MTDIVTLDGPAGSGKSTVAKRLARELGYEYLDTGATYRCVTLYFIRNNIALTDAAIPDIMKKIDIRFASGRVFLNDVDVTEEIRTKPVNDNVSPVSTIPAVRESLVGLQRRIARGGRYVIDGRDIGTVVFPDARYKFYIDASADERARRRHTEETAKGFQSSFDDVKKNVVERDRIDSSRAHSPLAKAADAYYVDTTGMSIDDVVRTVTRVIEEKRDGTMERHDEETRELTAEEIEFRKALEGANETKTVRGEIITAHVIQTDDTHVYVSLGGKSEGKIKLEEFRAVPEVGAAVEVVVSGENNSGEAYVSKIAADRIRSRDVVDAAFANASNVRGVVKSAVKGGFIVSVGGLDAFCPRSLIDSKRTIEEKDYIDQEYDFRIIEKKGRDLVVSRRKVLDEIAEYTIGNFFEHLNVGDVIRGTVKNIESFGIFVEVVPGLDGFLAFSNIAWDKVKEPTKALKKGEVREFKVLAVDKDKRKIDLGIKQLSADPWNDFIAKYKAEDVVSGEVTSIKEFGAFIRVYSGVEGLAHISELSWAKHVKHPKDIVKVGDFVDCMILGIDNENRKLSLGLRQVKPNPWENASKLFPSGATVECTVKKIFRNYAVLGLSDDLEGTIDVSDFDWKNAIVNIDNIIKEGETVKAKVLSVDGAARKIKLGIKHLSENPWASFKKEHPVGSTIDGTIVNIIDSGAIVKLTDDIEGFVHVSQLDTKRTENAADVVKIGETYSFAIKAIEADKRRISLSRKDYFSAMEKKDAEKYLSKEDPNAMTYSFADKLKHLEK